ncbi:MAG: hypothetical protein AB7O38_09810 [Pirellulaceae bacterium]
MLSRAIHAWGLSAICLMLALVGAGCQQAPSSPTSGPVSETPAKAPLTDEERIAAEMAKLPEADRKLAMVQKICPVSEAPLGSMEGLMKVHVNGRDVFICCSGCEEFLKAEPEKYLAKIPVPETKP